jgi:hypothetical protein
MQRSFQNSKVTSKVTIVDWGSQHITLRQDDDAVITAQIIKVI